MNTEDTNPFPDKIRIDPEPPHEHHWIPAGVLWPFVYFGCECGEALKTRAREDDKIR